jgi:hypothetical protein
MKTSQTYLTPEVQDIYEGSCSNMSGPAESGQCVCDYCFRLRFYARHNDRKIDAGWLESLLLRFRNRICRIVE